jgi:hypothetical protein
VTIRVSVRVDRDARFERRWATDSEQLRCDVNNHNATMPQLGIISFDLIDVERGGSPPI